MPWPKGRKRDAQFVAKMQKFWGSKEFKERLSISAKKSYIKGREPTKYWEGKKMPPEMLQKLSIAHKGKNLGENNGMWKGDMVTYVPLHKWVRRHKGKVNMCEMCGLQKRLDLANISQKYKRDLSDWKWICRKCHMLSDGRLEIFLDKYGKKTGCMR